MDFPFRHWSPISRRFPFALQVANTNFLQNRTFRLQRTFENIQFSYLLKGRGNLICNGVAFEVEAPCAFTVYPGEEIDCGPSSSADAWNHLYFDYESRYIRQIEASRLVDRKCRTWRLANPANIWTMGEKLRVLSLASPLESAVDEVDRLCERIIMESKVQVEEEDPHRAAIQRMVANMNQEPGQPFDLSETARLIGVSEATFRRRWMELVGVTPRRYLEQIRIQEACRMLVETTLPVREIARKVGFEDEFYFSRRFRGEKAMSPRAYRQRHAV